MATKKKIDEKAVEKAMDEATKSGLPSAIFEEKETPVVSDPYMAVQGSPVAPSKTYVASREGDFIELLVPVPFTQALLVYLSDYARCVDGEANGADISIATILYEAIHAHVLPVYPADEVFQSVLSMLERMEKIYLAEKANQL